MWYHECNLDWMRARQSVLTASDIKDLLPVTPSGRKRIVDDLDRLKVLARKKVVLTKDDCISTGVAARGHIMEPYAIELWNANKHNSTLYHWDDVVVRESGSCIGFSPDACDIVQPDEGIVFDDVEAITTIGEVKSYSPEKHTACSHKRYSSALEERWQIATAMYVCPNLDTGFLIFFNPDIPELAMTVRKYDRPSLRSEIEVIQKIVDDWRDFIATRIYRAAPVYYRTDCDPNLSSRIKEEYEMAQRNDDHLI